MASTNSRLARRSWLITSTELALTSRLCKMAGRRLSDAVDSLMLTMALEGNGLVITSCSLLPSTV
jgi:hypothetical protein